MTKKYFQWGIGIGFLVVLAACTALVNPEPASTTFSVPQPTMSMTFPATEISTLPVVITATLPTPGIFIPPAPIQDTPFPLQPTPGNVIGGGTVQDGPFDFDFRLFRDPSFNQQPVAAGLYSDLDGTGAYLWWVYQGSEAIGPVQTYWGTLPHVDPLDQATFTSINPGSSGGRTGGVDLPGGFFLPGVSKAGDPIQVALKVHTPNGDFGAVLHFTLIQGVHGFEPIDISVGVLPPGG